MIALRMPGAGRIACAVLLLLGTSRAGASVWAGNLASQTWTPSGNPYELIGDVIIVGGATLEVRGDTQVIAAAGDALAGGASTSQVEFIVDGALSLDASAGSSISFGPESGASNSSWYGIQANSGSSVSLSGLTSVAGDTRLLAGSSFNVSLGNPQSSLALDGSLLLGGNLQILDNPDILSIGDSFTIVDIAGSNAASGTFAGLADGATLSSGAVDWGISYAGGSGNDIVLSVVDIDLPATPGGGGAGPGSGTPCSGGAGSSLSGSLGNLTLTCADSPVLLTGDTGIAANATLKILGGVSVGAAASDDMASGIDVGEVELSVFGTLSLDSLNGAPVVIGPAQGQGTDGWSGVIVNAGGELATGATSIIDGDLRLEQGSRFFSSVSDAMTYGNIQLGGDLYLDGILSLFIGDGYTPSVGDFLTLFELDLGQFVYGGFTGLGEGSIIGTSRFDFQISYAGGDGNDVVLSVLRSSVSPVPVPAAFWLMASGLGSLGLWLRRRAPAPLRGSARAGSTPS